MVGVAVELTLTFADSLCDRDWRFGRDLRASSRLRPVLPRTTDPDVFRLPRPGEVLRDDHGRDCVLLVIERRRRRCQSNQRTFARLP